MRIDQITFTRFIAAMAIVFFHFGKPLNIFSNHFIHTLLVQANIGVSYFFILSGFVMMIAYGSKPKIHPISYLQNRFARIYPIYLLAIILSVFYQYYVEKKPLVLTDILLNSLALQSWIPSKAMSVNFPGWSLSVEFLFYAVFPLIFNYLYIKFSLKKLVIPILLFWIFSQILFMWAINSDWQISEVPRETENFLFYFPLMHLNQFLLGNLAGLFFIIHLKNKANNYDWAIILLSVILVCALYFKLNEINYHNGLLAVFFVPFIILFSLNNGYITRLFSKKIFIYLGEISYGIYILQIPVFMMTKYILLKIGISGDLVIFIIGIMTLLIFSAISYQYIEIPLREKIKKLRIPFK